MRSFSFAASVTVVAVCTLPVARAQPAAPPPTASDLAPALSQMLGESMFREAQLRARLTAVSEQLEAETAHARQLDERVKALTPAPAQSAAPAAPSTPAPSDTPAAP